MVLEERSDALLSKIILTILTALATNGGVCEQVVEGIPQIWKISFATVALKVTNQLVTVGFDPSPVRKRVEDGVLAGSPTRIGVKLFKFSSDLSLK